MNRPGARNALSPELMEELAALVEGWDEDPDVRCVVIEQLEQLCLAGSVALAPQAEAGEDRDAVGEDEGERAEHVEEDDDAVHGSHGNAAVTGPGHCLGVECADTLAASERPAGSRRDRGSRLPSGRSPPEHVNWDARPVDSHRRPTRSVRAREGR